MVRKTPKPERQTGEGETDERQTGEGETGERHTGKGQTGGRQTGEGETGVGGSAQPDGAVIAPGDGDRLFGVQVKCPQLALTVTLHQENRFVPVSDHDLEDLAVLCSRQDPVSLPANTADRQTCNRKHT